MKWWLIIKTIEYSFLVDYLLQSHSLAFGRGSLIKIFFSLCSCTVLFISIKFNKIKKWFLFSLWSWRVAAVSWNIKHVCIHSRGASLHADFAGCKNKFGGPSVREVGVICLPPQFHTDYTLISATRGPKEIYQMVNMQRPNTGAELLTQRRFLLGYHTVCTWSWNTRCAGVISCWVLNSCDAPRGGEKEKRWFSP